MVSYKEYYKKCQTNYKNTNKSIYDFKININETIDIDNKLIDNISEKINNKFKNGKEKEEHELFIGFKEDLYDLHNDIEKISQHIIPQLEEKIYGCYLNLTRAYVYKNKKTEYKPSTSWLWHWDNHVDECIKIIIYLTDVNKDDGAFEYLRHKKTKKAIKMKTNKFGPNNWGPKDHPIHRKCRISDDYIKNQLKDYENFKVTGKKGTFIIFSQNIIHKANIPLNNERIILTLQVKPILNKRLKYFDRKYTKTFHTDKSAPGPSNPLITNN